MMVYTAALLAALAAAQQGSDLGAVNAALQAHDYRGAERLAWTYTQRHPDDAAGFLALGDALLLRPDPGRDERLRALRAYRRATEVARDSVGVWFRYAMAGMRFGNADGERVARDGLRRVMQLAPHYPDAWRQWLLLFRNNGDRRAMRELLAMHGDDPRVQSRIARLLIEEERYAEADSLLGALLRPSPRDPTLRALAAQSAYENGRTAAGETHYAVALANAAADSENVLWSQVLGIASPQEIAEWRRGVSVERRSEWFRQFWWTRSSNLFEGIGGRMAEHFRRWRAARRDFALTQPLADYQRDTLGRGANARPSAAEHVFYHRCESRETPNAPDRTGAFAPDGGESYWSPYEEVTYELPGRQRASSHWVLTFDAPDMATLDTGAALVGISQELGLDDRGLMLLRHGPPRIRQIGAANREDAFCLVNSLETWEYDGIGAVRFFRPEDVNLVRQGGASYTGSPVFRPILPRHREATLVGVTTDRTSAPAALRFITWFAAFPTEDPSRSELYAIASADTIALLASAPQFAGPSIGHDGSAALALRAARHKIEVHAVDGGLGRVTTRVTVRPANGALVMSDLLLAAPWPGRPDSRLDVLRHVNRTLTFRIGEDMRVYAEIRRRTAAAPSTWRIRYELVPGSRGRDSSLAGREAALRVEFDREISGDFGTEWTDIRITDHLAPGSYLLRLTIVGGQGQELARSQAVVRLER